MPQELRFEGADAEQLRSMLCELAFTRRPVYMSLLTEWYAIPRTVRNRERRRMWGPGWNRSLKGVQ